MAEKAFENDDPGGGGGFDPGGLTLTDEDAGFDGYVDAFNDANKSQHELNDPSDDDPANPKKTKRHVAPPAPPVDPTAPIGSKTNPVVVTKRGGQY